ASAAEQAKPEVRYAKGRVALARGDATTAIELFDGLEKDLPLLDADVKRWRAEAQLAVGPFDAAGEWFASGGTPAMLWKAAQAFDKGKNANRSRAACDRLITMDHRTRAQEADARAMRLRIATPGEASAVDDARWLATHGADLSAAKDAEAM